MTVVFITETRTITNLLAFGCVLISSVVVKEDKKLLTVLFPDGRDGRAFTLKVRFSFLSLP